MNQEAQSVTGLLEAVAETPFYIPVTGPASRPRRTLKHGDAFAVVDSHGDIGASSGGPDGIFHADTRHLSRMELLINGMQPLLLGSNLRDDNSVLTIDLTNPDIYFEKRLILPRDTVHLVRTIFLWRETFYQRVGIRNHGDRIVNLQLCFTLASDFADVFEVRGMRRPRRGTSVAELTSADKLVLRYEGLDGRQRRTTLQFTPSPTKLAPGVVSYALTLEPGEHASLFITVQCDGEEEKPVPPFFHGMRRAFHELREATRDVTTVQTSNDVFNEVLCRSMADLHMLITDTPEGPYPYAGIPWYSTTFGRDGIITALQMLWCNPAIARGVLERLAAYQAKITDPAADAEPGKILHEMRGGEMAALREVPFGLYYGSVDSTPLFVLLAGLYMDRTGDLATIERLWPHIEAALAWMDGPGDPDGDGFLEYHRATEEGLVNQGWKDSQDSVFHADGHLAQGPIALVEVQAYSYAARRLAARCARALGRDKQAAELERQAKRLAERFEQAFWCEEIGTYALALDGDKRQCAVRTSNAGHVLFAGLAAPDRAARVAAGFMQPQFFTGWGVRTVSSDEARYNPMSYHNGSVWPHDNALIAFGLANYGHKRAVERIFKGMFEAASYMDLRRLPELFCGFRRARNQGPTLYPVACSPQAWAAATPFALLQASLGLEFQPDQKQIRLHNPTLPRFLDEVVLRNLHLGGSSLDLSIRRIGEDVAVHVLRKSGQVQVNAVLD